MIVGLLAFRWEAFFEVKTGGITPGLRLNEVDSNSLRKMIIR